LQEATRADTYADADCYCAIPSDSNTSTPHTHIGAGNSLSSAASTNANAVHSLSGAPYTHADATYTLS